MKVKFLQIPKNLVTYFMLMHEIDKMWKIENNETQSHTIHMTTQIFYEKPLREKIQLEGDVALLSFLWYGNNVSTKENALSMELPETHGLLGCYKTLNPFCYSL